MCIGCQLILIPERSSDFAFFKLTTKQSWVKQDLGIISFQIKMISELIIVEIPMCGASSLTICISTHLSYCACHNTSVIILKKFQQQNAN